MTLLLDRTTIESLLDMRQTIAIMETAFAELAMGTVVMPQRIAMPDENYAGIGLFMPARLKGMGAFGIKAVTVYRNNPAQHQLPTTLATIILLDQETGKPLAIMDGGYITAMRTGAVSGLATKYMSRDDTTVAGILGTGVQARTQLSAICAVRHITKVVCCSTGNIERRDGFVRDMTAELNVQIEAVSSPREVIEAADVLAFATSAQEPIVNGDWFKEGVHINSVGSHTPNARELDTAIVVRARVVCDSTSACQVEAGDLMIPEKEGAFSWDNVRGALGDVVLGRIKGRENSDEITLFKSVGLSVQDIATAQFVYDAAISKGAGTQFEM